MAAPPADVIAEPAFRPPPDLLWAVYERLLQAYGPQGWWPADSPFEVCVGAVLTQNAAWGNVEQAIARLRRAGRLSLEGIIDCPPEHLGDLVRPSGYFNVKARRLRNLCVFLAGAGGLDALARRPLGEQRAGLLGVNGIGPETADDVLLYALDRPVFVIDTYTRRLVQRLGLATGSESYEALRLGFEQALASRDGRAAGREVVVFNEYHALIVRHAKVACRKRPDCAGCVLNEVCPGVGVAA
jgi:endonuclease-3 related protein